MFGFFELKKKEEACDQRSLCRRTNEWEERQHQRAEMRRMIKMRKSVFLLKLNASLVAGLDGASDGVLVLLDGGDPVPALLGHGADLLAAHAGEDGGAAIADIPLLLTDAVDLAEVGADRGGDPEGDDTRQNASNAGDESEEEKEEGHSVVDKVALLLLRGSQELGSREAEEDPRDGAVDSVLSVAGLTAARLAALVALEAVHAVVSLSFGPRAIALFEDGVDRGGGLRHLVSFSLSSSSAALCFVSEMKTLGCVTRKESS